MNSYDRDMVGIVCLTVLGLALIVALTEFGKQTTSAKIECLKNNPGHGEVCVNENY